MSSWANLQNDGWTKLSFWVKIVDIFWICSALQNSYRISSYSFRGNYSFLNLEIQRSWYIKPNFTAHKCAATIQWRKLYVEIWYSLLSLIKKKLRDTWANWSKQDHMQTTYLLKSLLLSFLLGRLQYKKDI